MSRSLRHLVRLHRTVAALPGLGIRSSLVSDSQRIGSECSQRNIHTTVVVQKFLDARDPDHEKKLKELSKKEGKVFEHIAQEKEKNKQTFLEAVQMYNARPDKYKRGHVEFLYASMDHLKEFHSARDIQTYKVLLDVFPKKILIPRGAWEVEFMHYPKQQQCAIDLLDIMEYNGVVPDDEMGYQLIEIFGKEGHVFRRYQRMMYWMPKFKNANPYPVPYDLPEDPRELARLALKRMAVDLQNEVRIYETAELESATDSTFVASAISPTQRDLIDKLPLDKPVYVEGGYFTWLRHKSLIYFILRAEKTDAYNTYQETLSKEEDFQEMFKWKSPLLGNEEQSNLISVPTVHEQDDGTILAMCITGSSSKESVASWINLLLADNPNLRRVPIIFTLRSPEQTLQVINDDDGPQGRKKEDST